MESSILFLVFNRPDTTSRVFKIIQEAKPKRLYLAADGHRESVIGEKQLCEQVRAIITQIDWECKVETLFRERNLGCKLAVSSAITWFFEHEEEGIILEDDCLPSLSFFDFCDKNLIHYRDDDRIGQISGNNFQDGKLYDDKSYYFSKYAHIWGWASWRRAWKYYDVNIEKYNSLLLNSSPSQIEFTYFERKFWKKKYDEVLNGKLNTWDFQWMFCLWGQNMICITPAVNLVSNIGFGIEATNTSGDNKNLSNLSNFSLGDIIHPKFMVPNLLADRYTFRYKYSYSRNLFSRIFSWLKNK